MHPISKLPFDFFESVTFHPLDHRAGKFNISTNDYFVFGCEDRFRGIKKAYTSGSKPFYLTHREVFDGARDIFFQLMGHEADLVTVFTDEEKTWNAFVFTSSRRLLKEVPDSNVKNSYFEIVEDAPPFRHFPLVGSINYYGLDKNPAFFYLIGTPFRPQSGALLTLENFRFNRDADKERFVYGTSRGAALEAICQVAAEKFRIAQSQFDHLLQDMHTQYITFEQFAPVMLDMYDKNRNPQSVQNDGPLRTKIRQLHGKTSEFVYGRSYVPWTELMHFIIQENGFFLDKKPLLESVEELFGKKESYRKFERLFGPFLTDRQRFERYAADQIGDWQRIERIVMN